MASDFFGDVIKLGLFGGAAYLAYSWWEAQSAQAAATPATSTPAAPPAYVYTPPTIQQQMQTSAQSNTIVQAQGGQADAYQWAAIWAGIGQPAITNVNSIFFPNGLPANQSSLDNTAGNSQQDLPLMSLTTFLQGLQANNYNTGLSGVGQAGPTYISVPIMIARQKSFMRLPAGTTPAQLQSQLAAYGAGRVR